MPNGDQVVLFNGSNQYLTIPTSGAFSIPTTRYLTWEAWVQPSVLQFPHSNGDYVDFMGKCANYSPTCEWESRMYNNMPSTPSESDRCDRLSAYAFNPNAGKGAAADWQPASCTLIQPNQWIHV